MPHPARHTQPLPHDLQPQRLQTRRLGPRPLPLHLMTALCAWLNLPTVWPQLNSSLPVSSNASLPWSAQTPALQKLQILAADLPTPEIFQQALTQKSARRLHDFLDGVQAYRHALVQRDLPEMPVIWRRGTTCLRDYNPAQPHAPIVLVIPSLVNRYTILDIDRDHSFLRSLAAQGLRPLVVDWGAPGSEEKTFALADYIQQRLVPMLDSFKASVHLAGYCMGGNLALGLAALRPQQIASLTLIATPWDFHQPETAQATRLTGAAQSLTQADALSVDILQSLFAAIEPMQTPLKFARFARLDPASAAARHFVLVEDWLNDGVPLAKPVALEILQDWYGANQPMLGQWCVGDILVDPCRIFCPSYILAPGKDRIVPPKSSTPLAQFLPRATLHQPMSGHIGLMAGRNAPRDVWQPWFEWLHQFGESDLTQVASPRGRGRENLGLPLGKS